MTVVSILDSIAIAACVAALAALIAGRSRIEGAAIKPALAGLFLLTLLESVFLLMEWSGLTNRFDRVEDFVGALIPVWWGFLFYTFVQYESTLDLRRSEERMDLALRGADLGTWDWSAETGEVTFDERWAAMIGYSPADLEPTVDAWKRLLHPDDAPSVIRALEAHFAGETELFEMEHRMRHRSGRWIWVLNKGRVIERDDGGRPLRACGTHLDITERKSLQDELAQSRKMESIGRLAGGVAHDFNNLLTPILGYGEMLQEDLDPGDPRRESVDEMLDAGHRARELVAQLLAFSRRQTLNVEPVDLAAVITGFENLLRSTLPENVAIVLEPATETCPVMADAGAIEQVILNLAVNAAHAMPEGGTLTIGASVVENGDESAPGGRRRQVRLRVADTGSGIDTEVVENIFEPFFTTKGERGTGLGLSMVHGIIEQHEGRIRVSTQRGRGTTFEIDLPVTDSAIVEAPAPLRETNELRGTETVLLVDDNDSVRSLTRTLLARRGFDVLVAGNAQESLAILATHEGRIHLLLTDVIMPGLNGKELYEEAAAIRPGLKVLYVSGYAHSIVGQQGLLQDDVPFIQKPYSGHALVAKVREVLDR